MPGEGVGGEQLKTFSLNCSMNGDRMVGEMAHRLGQMAQLVGADYCSLVGRVGVCVGQASSLLAWTVLLHESCQRVLREAVTHDVTRGRGDYLSHVIRRCTRKAGVLRPHYAPATCPLPLRP